MNEIALWILVIIGISIPPVIAVWLDHYFNKKKKAAETEKIQLQNKITKEITYDQLKSEGKHKDIKSKLEIFQRLTKLEEEIKNKENKSASDQKKLESLEMIKKEFKETFAETKEVPKLVEEEKKLASKKESNEESKKITPVKPTLKSQRKKKKKNNIIILAIEDAREKNCVKRYSTSGEIRYYLRIGSPFSLFLSVLKIIPPPKQILSK